jgi:hypothetical protein
LDNHESKGRPDAMASFETASKDRGTYSIAGNVFQQQVFSMHADDSGNGRESMIDRE